MQEIQTGDKPQDSVVDKPGQELSRHRVQVSFVFDVACNTGPIINASDDTEAIAHDLALLKSFLVADKEKLLMMMVDAIGTKLGMHSCETFMLEFLPQVNTEPHELFKPAMDALDGEEGEYWKDIRGEIGISDYLDLCTEELFKCFSAEFVSSSYETVVAMKQ